MSNFLELMSVADEVVMEHFAHQRLRWTKTGGATAELQGIIDLELEMLGPHGELAYQGKAITFRSTDIAGYRQGETIQELSTDGTPVGKVFHLQQPLDADGGLTTIEVTT